MISIAIGIGLILNFFFFELLGLSLGGIVVPGFLALEMQHPLNIVTTITVSIATFFIIKLLSNFMMIYGRRQLIIAMLIGFLLNEVLSRVIAATNFHPQLKVVGYILPGIIAYWMERQGPIRTLLAMMLGAVSIYLILIILTGGKFAI